MSIWKKCGAYFVSAVILAGMLSSPLLAAEKSSSGESSSSSQSSSEKSSSGKESSSEKSSSSEESSSSKKEDTKSNKKSSSSEDASSKPLVIVEDPANPSTPASVSDSGGFNTSASIPPPPFEEDLQSKNIIMINLDSNTIVYRKEDQARIYPASLTKIMTCILALENVKDLDSETTDLKTYIESFLYTNKVSTLGGIRRNEPFSIRDLLYAMMLPSANEAAMMVADYVGGGDMDAFCEMMNRKAKEIGAKNTHFSNATGLFDENNYSTAYDLALIARYAWESKDIGEEFQKIVTTNAYTSSPTEYNPEGIRWYSRNLMQQASQPYYYEGLRGIKTGSLPDQNITSMISTASRDGYTYLLVAACSPIYDKEGREYEKALDFVDTALLYNWAFETCQVKTLMNVGKKVTSVDVRLSWDKDRVDLVAADKFASLVTKETTEDSITPQVVLFNAKPHPSKNKKGEVEYSIDAPVEKGAQVGYVRLMLGGEEVGRVRLVAAESVEQSKALMYLDKVQSFFKTFLFKFVLTFLIVVVVLYIVLMIIRNRNRRRYRMRRKPQQPPTQRKK